MPVHVTALWAVPRGSVPHTCKWDLFLSAVQQTVHCGDFLTLETADLFRTCPVHLRELESKHFSKPKSSVHLTRFRNTHSEEMFMFYGIKQNRKWCRYLESEYIRCPGLTLERMNLCCCCCFPMFPHCLSNVWTHSFISENNTFSGRSESLKLCHNYFAPCLQLNHCIGIYALLQGQYRYSLCNMALFSYRCIWLDSVMACTVTMLLRASTVELC